MPWPGGFRIDFAGGAFQHGALASRRSSPRPSRPAPRRWQALLLPLALVLSLLGRGHVFQMMGWLPCWEEAAAAQVPHEPDDAGDRGNAHEDCPASCHQCPCGQIPMVSPDVAVLRVEVVLELTELDFWTPPTVCGEAHAHRVDRPPRRLAVS